MIDKKEIKKIIKNFTVNNKIISMDYSDSNNKLIAFKPELKQKMLNLFDFKKETINKSELTEAFVTILSWYIFYSQRFEGFPKTRIIYKEMKEFENSIDELLRKFGHLNVFSKYVLKTYKHKNERIFNHNWLRPPHKIHRPSYREWSDGMTLINRRIVRLNLSAVPGQNFMDQFKERWYSILWNIHLTKCMKREQNRVIPFVNNEFFENLALISSWTHNRCNQLEVERAKFLKEGKSGEHSMAELTWPSPQIFLMRECGLLLATNGCDIENYFELAKLIHAQSKSLYVCSTKGSISNWGKKYKKEVGDWLKEIKPYVGKCVGLGSNGEGIKCIFPARDQFPTFFTPTLSHCPRVKGDNDPPYPEIPFPEQSMSEELRNGPGWERAGLAQI